MSNTTNRFLMAAAGAGGGKTYVDDVFSTYLYKGDGTQSNAIDNGVDLTEGGLVWLKSRSDTMEHYLFDTVRGATKYLNSATNGNEGTASDTLTSFNNNGFTLSDSGAVNSPSRDMVSWSFRKAPGFCDVVTFTSTGAANQRISHSLGCEPGMILCKSLTGTSYWVVYHKEIPNMNPSDPWSKSLILDGTSGATTYASDTWGTGPTSTDFGFKAGGFAATGIEWVAYVFAGGESTAATARSVAFSSTGSNTGAKSLTIANSSDTDFGSGDFTMECWFKDTRNSDWSDLDTIFSMSGYTNSSNNDSFSIYQAQGGFVIFNRTGGGFDMVVDSRSNVSEVGQWHHFAWTRSGSGTSNNKIWLDGNLHSQFTRNVTYADGQDFYIGGNQYSGGGTPNEYGFNGNISNVRITKGQAIYTNSFKPSNEPLTTTTGGAIASNVKVICCNNSSITGSTLTSGTISSTNTPTASTDSPFDDIEGYKFGKNEDQNIIKTGSYVGNGNANGPEVYLGWEPSWVMVKRATGGSGLWLMSDSMRGIVTGGDDPYLQANDTNAEYTSYNWIELTPTGFKLTNTGVSLNDNGSKYIYITIRRPDGLVGKPAKVGTDVFAMDGSPTNNFPAWNSGFPVDFALDKKPAASGSWETTSRFIPNNAYSYTNTTATEATYGSTATGVWRKDSNTGFGAASSWGGASVYQAWMWKRHAGFDVVTWTGNGQNPRTFSHSLGRSPEMIWTKGRNSSYDWRVWHKDLNAGGSSAAAYNIVLNSTGAQSANQDIFGGSSNVLPSSTNFTTGGNAGINESGTSQIAYLFASVTGISKVGSYDGTGVVGLTQTTGFNPRFLIIKNITWTHGDWFVYDTTRGWASGTNGEVLTLNNTGAQSNSGTHKTSPTSTGFSVDSTDTAVNASGQKYIYYAHA